MINEAMQKMHASLHIEVAQISKSMRSIIREELETFFLKQMTENGLPRYQAEPRGLADKGILQKPRPPERQESTRSEEEFSSILIEAERPTRNVTKHGDRFDESPSLVEPLLADTGRRRKTTPTDSAPTVSGEAHCPLAKMFGSRYDGTETDRLLHGAFDTESDEMRESKLRLTAKTRKQAILTGIVTDENEIRERLAEALLEPMYVVDELYYKTGLCQSLARQDSYFSFLSLIIVAINVIWIGVDTDIDKSDVLNNAPVISKVMDNFFCAYFTFELCVRYFAFAKKINALKDPMFVFDLILVGFMSWETWIEVFLYWAFDMKDKTNTLPSTQLFRLFRLIRFTRIARIMKLSLYFPELLILVKGMKAAMRSVAAVFVFLSLVIGVFGILFTEFLRDTDTLGESFSGVVQSMLTLLLQVLVGSDVEFMTQLIAINVYYWVIYMVFFFLAMLTLMNMLIGVLCDIVSDVSSQEKQVIDQQRLDREISVITNNIDLNQDGFISNAEFHDLMTRKEALKSLNRLGVDVVTFGSLAHFIFSPGVELTMKEFCHLVSQFRNDNHTNVKDLLAVRRFISLQLEPIQRHLRQISQSLYGGDFSHRKSFMS